MSQNNGITMNRDQAVKSLVAEVTCNLMTCVQDAGGAVGSRILNMTMREFITEVAANNRIRFVYNEKFPSIREMEKMLAREAMRKHTREEEDAEENDKAVEDEKVQKLIRRAAEPLAHEAKLAAKEADRQPELEPPSELDPPPAKPDTHRPLRRSDR